MKKAVPRGGVYAACIIAIIALMYGCHPAAPPPTAAPTAAPPAAAQTENRVSRPDLALTYVLPAGWHDQQPPEPGTVIHITKANPDGIDPFIQMVSQKAASDKLSPDVVQTMEDAAKQHYNEYKRVSATSMQIDRTEAQELQFTCRLKTANAEVHEYSVMTNRSGQLYVVKAMMGKKDAEKFGAEVDQFLQSIRWK